MKEFISKPASFRQVEFWGATTVFVFAVFFLISDALQIGRNTNTAAAASPFDYYFVSKLIRYIVLYASFLLLNFRIVPALAKKESPALNIFYTVVLFFIIGLIYGIVNTFLRYRLLAGSEVYGNAHNVLFQKSFLYALWLLLMFGFYSVVKYTGLYLLSRTEVIQSKYKWVTPGGVMAFVLWMICLFFLIVGGAHRIVTAAWAIIVPSGILFYWYAFHLLIPKSLIRKKPFRIYMVRTFWILQIAAFPIIFLSILLAGDDGPGLTIGTFNSAFHLLVTAPLCWVVYKRQMQGQEELSGLKRELGQSHASFDFLRSQINPHFLFNALNTIYGTALQEGAERTGEGVERLSSMMRFMLQENMQEKISLAREIEYLNNYISLQKLRTDSNPIVKIDTAVQLPVDAVQIAPMLLIPFVENAFKHGISFQEPSHIKITLELKGRTLYFDVYNSKHIKGEADPEKDKSGIGLTNVKQRLRLLYPAKHELVVRETGKDFFVHLTMQLS